MPDEGVQSADILEWDTAFFGFRIARLRGELLRREQIVDVDAWCQQHGIACLYFLAGVDDSRTTRVAEDHGFHLVDIRLTFERKLEDDSDSLQRREPATAVVRPATQDDLPALQRIARESYHDTRFYYDAHFPAQKSDALYETWITKSCRGEAQRVLVAERSGIPIGFITCHLDKKATGASIGLVGVSTATQGQGIGQLLVSDALAWFQSQDAKAVTVVTQGRNVAAQRLYERSGFLIRGVRLWYHKWYKRPDEL